MSRKSQPLMHFKLRYYLLLRFSDQLHGQAFQGLTLAEPTSQEFSNRQSLLISSYFSHFRQVFSVAKQEIDVPKLENSRFYSEVEAWHLPASV